MYIFFIFLLFLFPRDGSKRMFPFIKEITSDGNEMATTLLEIEEISYFKKYFPLFMAMLLFSVYVNKLYGSLF